jgi:putative transposase
MFDRKAAQALTSGLSALWPRIDTAIADAGYESRKLARHLQASARCRLKIVKRNQRAFKIVGLNWIVERSFRWLGRHRRMSKDYQFRVQMSETLITIVACAQMLRRLAPQ